jgi:hypothetical protein
VICIYWNLTSTFCDQPSVVSEQTPASFTLTHSWFRAPPGPVTTCVFWRGLLLSVTALCRALICCCPRQSCSPPLRSTSVVSEKVVRNLQTEDMIGLMCCPVRAIAQFAWSAIDVWGSRGKPEELGESPASVPLRPSRF